jgi:cell wall-associated NlpC family hydrolase
MPMKDTTRLRISICAAVLLLIAACTSTPRLVPATEPGDQQGAAIARVAMSLVGTPYEFGGADAHGFDCSGLAVYAHAAAGLDIPRTARDQDGTARPIALRDLRPGDLLFFRISSRHVNHVGIYIGERRFVHAPRRGEVVTVASLDDPYFRKRLVRAGRFWRPP